MVHDHSVQRSTYMKVLNTTKSSDEEYPLENVVCKMGVTIFMPLCVDTDFMDSWPPTA